MNAFISQYRDELARFFILVSVIEVLILLFCWVYSWDRSYLQVSNPRGELIYEKHFLTSAHEISKAEAIIEANSRHEGADSREYRLTVRETARDFPVRAWISAAIGVPLAMILFAAFVLRAFQTVLKGAARQADGESAPDSPLGFEDTPLDGRLRRLTRLNVFVVGGAVLLSAMLLWLVPELVMETSRAGLSMLTSSPGLGWALLAVGALGAGFWGFTKYRLSLELIRQQAELQRRRDALTFELKKQQLLLAKERTPELLERDES